MDGLFPARNLKSFGTNRLDASAEPPLFYRIASPRISGLRVLVRQECPRRPGVYGMFSDRGELLYIGKAKCLRARLLSYFRVKSRDPKAGRILRHTVAIAWEHAPCEFAALLRELELIRRWRPRFNCQGQPGRRRPVYVCLARRPAPQVVLSRFAIAGAVACYGPVPAGRRAREAVRCLNDWYRLRDCPRAQEMIFAEDQELFPIARAAGCLRHEIGTCLGPCLAACTRRDYMNQVQAACAFLDGTNGTVLDTLKAQMQAAAAALLYEQAARLRDRLDALTWLQERLRYLRRARQRQSFIYPVVGQAGEQRWYLVRHGHVVTSVAPPVDVARSTLARQALDHVYQQLRGEPGPVPASEVDGVFLVMSWFHRHPAERARILSPRAALAACAQAALQLSGLETPPDHKHESHEIVKSMGDNHDEQIATA
jgi:excinuclease ABC subunit C